MPLWEAIMQNRSTGLAIASLTDLSQRRFSFYLGQPGDVQGQIDLKSTQASRVFLQAGVHEMILRREGVPIETVFQLATADPRTDDEGNGTIDLGFLGIMSYLSDLTIGPKYTKTGSTDAVVMDVVNTVQAKTNGNYGFVSGSHTASQPTATLQSNEEFDAKEAITRFTDDNGFDWSIGLNREVNTYYPRRGTDKSTTTGVFEHKRNCIIARMPEDAGPGGIANFVKAKGGDSTNASASDAASQLVYGRREAIVAYPQVTASVTRLQSLAAAAVAARKNPVTVPEITVDTLHADFIFGDPWLGDTIRVIGDIGDTPYRSVDDTFRIVAIHVEVDEQDHEIMTFELNPS